MMTSISEVDASRRQLLVLLLSSGALATLPSCTLSGLTSFGKPRKLPAGQSIFEFQGDVKVNGEPATLETVLAPDDVVETSDRSYVIFVNNQDAVILRSGSRFSLPSGAPGSGYRLEQGKALTVLASRRTRIETPLATIGIRGTGVYVETDPERSYVCTCYGETDLEAADDPSQSETIVSEHHNDPRYILADRTLTNRIQRAPFINHDDQELLLIETLVGRTTPYLVPGGLSRRQGTYF